MFLILLIGYWIAGRKENTSNGRYYQKEKLKRKLFRLNELGKSKSYIKGKINPEED